MYQLPSSMWGWSLVTRLFLFCQKRSSKKQSRVWRQSWWWQRRERLASKIHIAIATVLSYRMQWPKKICVCVCVDVSSSPSRGSSLSSVSSSHHPRPKSQPATRDSSRSGGGGGAEAGGATRKVPKWFKMGEFTTSYNTLGDVRVCSYHSFSHLIRYPHFIIMLDTVYVCGGRWVGH